MADEKHYEYMVEARVVDKGPSVGDIELKPYTYGLKVVLTPRHSQSDSGEKYLLCSGSSVTLVKKGHDDWDVQSSGRKLKAEMSVVPFEILKDESSTSNNENPDPLPDVKVPGPLFKITLLPQEEDTLVEVTGSSEKAKAWQRRLPFVIDLRASDGSWRRSTPDMPKDKNGALKQTREESWLSEQWSIISRYFIDDLKTKEFVYRVEKRRNVKCEHKKYNGNIIICKCKEEEQVEKN